MIQFRHDDTGTQAFEIKTVPNALLAAENNAGKNPITEWSTTDDENMYFIIV